MKNDSYKGRDRQYSRDEIKDWINFGVYNGYINKYKKDQIIKWVDLLLKNKVTLPKIFTPKRPHL